MKPTEYYLRLTIICLVALSPLFCILLSGYQKSYSSYWITESQPIFILANAVTAFYLFQEKHWRISALLLLLVTAFNTYDFKILHDILAIAFFISCLIDLTKKNRNAFIIMCFMLSFYLLNISILLAEIVAITSLCLYHGLNLITYYKLTHGKEKTE